MAGIENGTSVRILATDVPQSGEIGTTERYGKDRYLVTIRRTLIGQYEECGPFHASELQAL